MMLDIVDMCKLLDYEEGVCLARKLAPLPRSYFEVPGDVGGGVVQYHCVGLDEGGGLMVTGAGDKRQCQLP